MSRSKRVVYTAQKNNQDIFIGCSANILLYHFRLLSVIGYRFSLEETYALPMAIRNFLVDIFRKTYNTFQFLKILLTEGITKLCIELFLFNC